MPRLACLAALLFALPAQAAEDFAYVRSAAVEGSVVVDTRPLADCRAKSLADARCLPAEDFLGPQRRPPSARDLLWLLGTAGLSGEEGVLTEPLGRAFEAGAAAGPGRERGMIREAVFVAPMRDNLLVLRDELRALRPQPQLLDGRGDAEYWGETVRAARSGHLPGAVSLPALQLRAALGAEGKKPVLPDGPAVAYAHDAFEGLAYLALLIAGHGAPARLYAEGWAEWAADGALPADAVAYPERAPTQSLQSQPPQDGAISPGTILAAALAFALAAFGFGWWSSRRRLA